MGVIHKTKEQIREYILQEKKADPGLSCRQLAPLIQKQFGISLSKSTINSLFKQANLSAPVGRRSEKSRAEKTLPQILRLALQPPAQAEVKEARKEPVKKEEIILPPILAPAPPELTLIAPVPESTPPPEPPPPPPPKPAPAAPSPEPVKPVPEKPVPVEKPVARPLPEPILIPELAVIKEDTIKPPETEQPETSEPIEFKEDESLDALGCFFLKAAEWELNNESIIGSLLRQYLIHPSPEAIDLNSEILLFLGAFGLADWEVFEHYNQKGLWAVNLSKIRKSPETLLRFARSLKRLRGLSMALFNEYDQYLPEARYFKVTLEDKTVFYVDAQFRTLWQDSNIPEVLCVSNYKANSYGNGIFKDNVQSAILQTAPGSNAFSRILSEFIWCFEDLPGKNIARVTLFDLNRHEAGKTWEPSSERRYFILGFWPWQEEGMRFIREDLRIIKSFFLPEQNKEVFYSENATSISQHIDKQRFAMRVGLIRDTALGWPRFGVLTNIPKEDKTMAEVILAYLRRWPNQEEGYQDFVRKTNKMAARTLSPSISAQIRPPPREEGVLTEYTLSLASTDLHTNLNSLLLVLNNFCQRHFFPAGYERLDFPTMQKRFYHIAGHIVKRDNLLMVELLPPPNYAYLADLVYACQRINESDIQTPTQEKLVMKIAP
jgi:hypothetical protein